MVQLFKNNSVELFYFPELRISKINYIGIINMEEILKAYKFIIEHPTLTQSFAVVSDLSRAEGTYTMLLDYLRDNVFPFIAQKGIKYNAMILNSDPFIKFSTKKLIENIKDVEIKAFENEKDAFEWINGKGENIN